MEFEKYHKIRVLGDEENKEIFKNPEDKIIIEEKLDGGNFRFAFINGQLILGSRTRELDEDNPNAKNFKRCIEFVKEQIWSNLDVSEVKEFEHLIFYGECMVRHTMSYDWEKIPPFLGFDIKNVNTGKYVSHPDVEEIFKNLGLPFVPVIKVCKAKDIKSITDEDVPISKYPSPSSEDLQAEGIVLKNYSKGLFAKYVRDKFKELNRNAFGESKKRAREKGDEELIVATYCTNARIDKIIFKLMDDGEKLGMELMHLLPRRVIEDIYEEHSKEICMSNWSVNFKDIRKKINTRCLAVLKQVIANNSINYGLVA